MIVHTANIALLFPSRNGVKSGRKNVVPSQAPLSPSRTIWTITDCEYARTTPKRVVPVITVQNPKKNRNLSLQSG